VNSRRLLCAGVAATVVSVAAVASAAGPRAGVTGLHNARYCEIIELKGGPPNGSAVVWNTIGQDTCPAKIWNKLDAAKLAKERGDTLVLLNGPRHFLMDSASAVVGGHHTFHGLKTTKVATIPIRTAADLNQTPYTDRTVKRNNVWAWKKGRTLFELVAPGGDVYVMQADSQIKDPKLTLAQLPALGRRLALPPGWKYRTRRLKHPYVMSVTHQATIIQDELQDTYQLAALKPRGARTAHTLRMTGHTKMVKTPVTPGTVEDHGTVTGTPFGKGTIVLVGKLDVAKGMLTATYRLTFPRGQVIGDVTMPFVIAAGKITFHGTGHLTGGTGAYRGITAGGLDVHDHNTLDGQNGVLSVTGTVKYARAGS